MAQPDSCSGLRVQLRHATLPSALRWLAVHHWFVVLAPDRGIGDRWEVWQNRDAGGNSWGHLHQNLMHPDRPVGGGPTCIAAEWRWEAAERLRAVLEDPVSYPYRECYRYWPGPNSNTYAAWVLRRAGILHDFDPRGVGKDFLGRWGVGAVRAGGEFQLATPLGGLRLARSGAELHLLGLTFGWGMRPLLVKTPWGIVGRIRTVQHAEQEAVDERVVARVDRG